jgi:ubiquinone/menaquinone biosynthesis C-methylase UbiE
VLDQARLSEISKYEDAYKHFSYRMGDKRKNHVMTALDGLERGSLLDVGCGRGETMSMAKSLGFNPVNGLEAVDYLCDGVNVVNGLAHAIPFADKSFDVVTMFDVVEHLVPKDTDKVCLELERLARKTILLTVHNGPSLFNDVELHINRKESYEAWFNYFINTFSGVVKWLPRNGSISEMFRVDYDGSR